MSLHFEFIDFKFSIFISILGEMPQTRKQTIKVNETSVLGKYSNVVEANTVIAKRIRNGSPEYLIKWQGPGYSIECWTIKSELNCSDLIKKFDESCECEVKLYDSTKKNQSMHESGNFKIISSKKAEDHKMCTDLFVPEKIIGAVKINDETAFLFKLKGIQQCSFMLLKVARHKFPQLVIDFYENRIKWSG